MKRRSNGFISVDFEALLDTTISIREILPPTHLARFIVQVISHLDLSSLELWDQTEAGATYSPRTLLGLLFYSYATGVLSSQEIERATYESVDFYYVAGGMHPNQHAIREFRERHLLEIQRAFVQILVFVRAAGALKVGDFQLEGMDIFDDALETEALNPERLQEFKQKMQREVSELFGRAKNADQGEPRNNLILQNHNGALQGNPNARFAKAKALLDPGLGQHTATKEAKHDGSRNGNSNTRQQLDCRTCAARQRCIEATAPGPAVKLAIERKFKNGTDDQKIWTKLQQNCLLMQKAEPPTTSEKLPVTGLMRRLYQLQQSPDSTPICEPGRSLTELKHRPAVEKPAAARRLRPSSDPDTFAVMCVETQRVVRLPREGSIVLGRFEPDYAGPPDVDLAFDDGIVPSVSRRHARITARDGAHWIEDLGSTNGTYRNGFQLAIGERAQLQPGDRILLGRCRLVYDPAPLWVLEPGVSASDVSILTITHTGQSLGLPDRDEITIGRSDRDAAYSPDVDLSVADDIARHVLRQHARLVQHEGRHCVESADNAANIKVNGHPIRMGDSPVPLSPGDQLWLGGCVLAYEWRSFEEETDGFEHVVSRSLQKNGGAKRSTSTRQATQFLTRPT